MNNLILVLIGVLIFCCGSMSGAILYKQGEWAGYDKGVDFAIEKVLEAADSTKYDLEINGIRYKVEKLNEKS